MHSAFLVFDLIASNTTFKCEGKARGFIHPELYHGKEAVRLIVREQVPRVPAGRRSPKATGLLIGFLFLAGGIGACCRERLVESNTRLRVLTSHFAAGWGRRGPVLKPSADQALVETAVRAPSLGTNCSPRRRRTVLGYKANSRKLFTLLTRCSQGSDLT
jgi:hypothetical protein